MLPKLLVGLGFLLYLAGFIVSSFELPRVTINIEDPSIESTSLAANDGLETSLIQSATPTPIPISSTYYWPARITLKRAYINLPITEGGIVNGEWILSDKSALYLPTSKKIGEGGNTIIYAHNRRGMFYNLKRVKLGDTIIITDEKGSVFFYQVYSIQNIKPTAIEETETHLANTLTIFTCDGWLDQERLVVKAKLI